MEIAMKKNYDVGVVIGRFQTHIPHEGHIGLLKHVTTKHSKVIIFLGVSSVLGSKRNPLDFPTRKAMIQALPFINESVVILPIADCKSNTVWSLNLDLKIKEVFPTNSAVIYGSRDSFIPYYGGNNDTCELEPEVYFAAGDIRKQISNKVLESSEFRAGVIYANYNTYPTAYPVVDGIILDERNRILLGRKQDEDKYRVIGGFVDPTDDSYEHALRREIREETCIEVDDIRYLGSTKVDDWRYKNETDRGMVSAFYTCKYIFGTPTPKDDIVELRWFILIDALTADIVSGHKELLNKYSKHLKELSGSYINT